MLPFFISNYIFNDCFFIIVCIIFIINHLTENFIPKNVTFFNNETINEGKEKLIKWKKHGFQMRRINIYIYIYTYLQIDIFYVYLGIT